jgi:integrase/ribosomal protein L37E
MLEQKVNKVISWISEMKVPKDNIELVLKFDKEMEVNGRRITTRLIFLKNIRTFMKHEKKEFRDITKDDIINFFNEWKTERGKEKVKPALSSINNMKFNLKQFFRWFYKKEMKWTETEKEKYPGCVNDLQIKQYQLELKGKLLDPDEIQRLVDVCDNSRDRALMIFLTESGVRLGELLSMKIGDFKPNDVGGKVTITGKTGERTIPIVRSIPFLLEYLRQHPHPDDKDYPFWITLGKHYGEPLQYNSVRTIINKLRRRSGIKKRIYCHLLRHQSVLEKKTYLTEPYLRMFYGWSRNSDMPFRYGGTKFEELEKKINEHENVENGKEEKKEEKIKCERCGLFNPPETKFCFRCNYPLDSRTYIGLEERMNKVEDHMREWLPVFEALDKQPRLLKELKELKRSIEKERIR